MRRGISLLRTLSFIAISCDSGKNEIVDHYTVYDYVDYHEGNQVRAEHVLMCQLASKSEPFIKNVNQVEWRDSTMIAATDEGFFVIESNSYGLCCSCGNKTIGPLSEREVRNYKIKKGFKSLNKIRI